MKSSKAATTAREELIRNCYFTYQYMREFIPEADEACLFDGLVPRRRSVIAQTLKERGDPVGIFTAELTVDLGVDEPGASSSGGEK